MCRLQRPALKMCSSHRAGPFLVQVKISYRISLVVGKFFVCELIRVCWVKVPLVPRESVNNYFSFMPHSK